MNFYKIKTSTFAVLLSILAVSCGESTETQSQNGVNSTDPVITKGSGPTVALSSELVNVSAGEIFTLDITMSEFPTSEGGGVTVKFDSTMLTVNNVTIDSGTWDFANKVGGIDNNAGVISDILFSSFKGVSGDAKIASISFNAVASGNCQINLESSAINPFSGDGSKIAVNFVDTNVQISNAVN